MAFPIPSHLPRKKNQDVSTKLLTEISETSLKSLSQEVASKWVAELNVAIRQTKEEIHNRVHSDLPAFDQQLSSSKYVQERLQALETNVDKLSDTLSHPETGLVPKLIGTLTRHAALAQDAADAEVMHQAMSYLAHCKREMQNLASLVGEGRLPDAVALCVSLEHTLASSIPPLPATQVFGDIQRRFRALKDRTEDQLHEAYSRGLIVTASEIIIRPTVQVRASETVLSLQEILSSLSPASLATITSTLRRDLTSHYIDHLLTQPASLESSSVKHMTGTSELKLTVYHSPPNTEHLSSRIENACTLFAFLNENMFPNFPPSAKFLASLSKPLTTALLEKLLIPSVPSSASELPSFLELMQQAVKFEEDIIVGMLGGGRGERDIAAWAGGVAGHYERKRRVELLERARTVILRDEDKTASFRVEVTLQQSAGHETVAIQPDRAASPEEAAWGFDDDGGGSTPLDEDGWGFDDDVTPSATSNGAEPILERAPVAVPVTPIEGDPGDAWGWNDDEDTAETGDGDASTDSSAWDDPWGDTAESAPAASPVGKAPKAATKLEKLSNKGKNLRGAPPVQSPVPVPPPPPTPAMPSSLSRPSVAAPSQNLVEKEFYLVTGRMKELMNLVEDILREAADLSSSGVLTPFTTDPSQVGGVISPTAASVLELYRALFPVHADSLLHNSAKGAIQFSNNCIWLSQEVKRVASGRAVPLVAKNRLDECAERLDAVGELWFEDTIDGQCQRVNEILNEAEDFVGTTDQDRYDECEAAVNQVLQAIRQISQHTKPLLPKSKYYHAIGSIVDAALSRILKDILAIPDITEVESHKLSELCRIMNSLEGLFVEDPNHPSFVVDFVPSWFKFSYLSELLEASIADISYLFEEGTLVDFKIEELVNLVRALFADTPLRANTINKLMQGHPIPSS